MPTAPRDNFDPFHVTEVIGNDGFIGDTVVYIDERLKRGDDIMVGNGGQQDHYLGVFIDWRTTRTVPRRDRLLRLVVRS